MKLLKKFPIEKILKIPGYLPEDRVDIWLQDEARFGQQNTTTKLWAEKGTRPAAIQQQQFQYAYLFGAVCVTNGNSEAMVMPYANKEIMKKHLEQISNATAPDRYALVIVDGASWHSNDLETEFKNLSILKLPPYSPELNPIEQVWSWLRQHHLANRCFAGYEAIVDAICDAWNDFISEPSRVMNMCTRDWMH